MGSPTEIYLHPSTAFVARFVGSMNELPATVVDGDTVQVAGTAVAVPEPGRGSGSVVNLAVRPEDVRLSDDDNGGLPGTVVVRTFQGASSVVTTRLDVLDTLVSAHVQGTGSASAEIPEPG